MIDLEKQIDLARKLLEDPCCCPQVFATMEKPLNDDSDSYALVTCVMCGKPLFNASPRKPERKEIALRDQLAMAALTAIYPKVNVPHLTHLTNLTPQEMAEEAYGIADAMLEARKK